MIYNSQKSFLLFMVGLLLFSCQGHPKFIIQGQMSDDTFDGEQMYLVPLFDATEDKVDSCTISQGKFQFEGTADSSQVFILRPKPILRINIQEALVVKEEGRIFVKMGQSSFVGGTSTNDSLQSWKIQKEARDQKIHNLQLADRNLSGSFKKAIDYQIDSLIIARKNYYFEAAKRNQDNALGQMILKMLGKQPNVKPKS